MFRNTSLALLAMLAPQRRAQHALHAEILVVVFPQAEEFVDGGFLLAPAPEFGNVSGVFDHGERVKVGASTVDESEGDVEEWVA